MVCENCFVNKTEKFAKASCIFKSCQPMVIFLLNVILSIEKFWKDFCFCTDSILICSVCKMRLIYLNDQCDIYENSFNMDFLLKFHQHLIKNLNSLLEINCYFVCKVINEKYFYTLKDLFDGSKKHFNLCDCLNEFENKKNNQIKSNDFRIAICFFK